ncbi:gephyrin-like molybdotransferase receptor GlpR [Streptomyces sp. NPDC102451]|uniref:divisome protein SepX/GlpR n=1 Tax=Streptomyces sp. NPDC102451 TaxID=3366177 RepID=UPI0037F618F0
MPPCKPLYGVSVSSSGLIYAVIVGAWAAYLVPMWLRRQDELNEARPTERFSTAIRLLSGRAAMERRYAKELRERDAEEAPGDVDPDAVTDRLESVDVRAFSAPPAHTEARLRVPAPGRPDQERPQERAPRPAPARRPRPTGAETERERRRRLQVLARRRRTTTVLFMAFTLGAVVAAVGGLRFLWAPAVPAVLLSTYIVHLRAQERRRFVFTMDRRRAEVAAQRLRENRPRRHQPASSAPAEPDEEPEAAAPVPTVSPQEAGRRALVEQTDHAEWVDQQRERGPAQGDSWEPVPVPLPTYVTAPVAPRATGGVEVGDPETWSAARSSPAEPTRTGSRDAQDAPAAPEAEPAPRRRGTPPKRTRDRGRTPLFDQYDDEDRPRAANE